MNDSLAYRDMRVLLYSAAVRIVKARRQYRTIKKLPIHDDMLTPRERVAWSNFEATPEIVWAVKESRLLRPKAHFLSTVLESFNKAKCSERLDKINAVVGLGDFHFKIDYGRTAVEQFLAISCFLQQDFDLIFTATVARSLGLRGEPCALPCFQLSSWQSGSDWECELSCYATNSAMDDSLLNHLQVKLGFDSTAVQEPLDPRYPSFPRNKERLQNRVMLYSPIFHALRMLEALKSARTLWC
jgi:hypothetical protein